MLGRDVCGIVPKGNSGGCCGGGAKAPIINGFFTINIKSNKQPIYELLIPGDRIPSKWTAHRITHDNRLFTNCKLYEDGEELKILCVVVSPFRDEVVVFSPRNQHSAKFREVDAACQLNIYVRSGMMVTRNASVVDTGNGLAFNGVGNPDSQTGQLDPRDRNRSMRDLEHEFWATMLIIDALLYSSTSFDISGAGLSALRTVIDAVSRQEKIDAIARWAAALGNHSLIQQLDGEAKMRAQVEMETAKMEIEMQKERVRVETEQIELAKKQQELMAQRAALQATASPMVAHQTYNQPVGYQAPPAPMYNQPPPYGYQHQAPPPYHGQAPPPYYGGGPGYLGPPPGAYGYGGYGNNGGERRSHGTGKAVAMGLGAGVLGALVTDMIIG